MQVHAQFIWLCTGTPLSRSVGNLKSGETLLGHSAKHGLDLFRANGSATHPLGPWLVLQLRKLMMRHTKSMRIGGEVALSLPEADTKTIWLEFTPEERRMYNTAVSSDTKRMHKALEEGATGMALEMAVATRRAACSNAYAKNYDGDSVLNPAYGEDQLKAVCTNHVEQATEVHHVAYESGLQEGIHLEARQVHQAACSARRLARAATGGRMQARGRLHPLSCLAPQYCGDAARLQLCGERVLRNDGGQQAA